MVNPQRASGALRDRRQIQRAIDQVRSLALTNERTMQETEATIVSLEKALEALLERVKVLEQS